MSNIIDLLKNGISSLQYKIELLESRTDLFDSFILNLQTAVNNSNDMNDLKDNINILITKYNADKYN
jgi:hypothetical protein